MTNVNQLKDELLKHYDKWIQESHIQHNELTIDVSKEHIIELSQQLRDSSSCQFDCLVDICGVDYSDYGLAQWATEETTSTGFSRGVQTQPERIIAWDKPRFAVVYHLLSVKLNHRLRIRCFLSDDDLIIPSAIAVWPAANWFEREAFDLFGIYFDGHPDLRRILTDYGFIGHPFRKDFPLIGNLEARYDATEGRVVYEPVSIEPRTLVPKVIREDSRYQSIARQNQAKGE